MESGSFKDQIIESAAKQTKSHLADGKCSLCGALAGSCANFCWECGATFLSEAQISRREVNSDKI
ncbi:MAG: hypothetical protein G01um101420_726 [Parcubacteria group bacterium Gr01-1014_20]|nr:MAG: hypothetical protein G01um101420_726 [Parcubacteria group bacterium Gr01-1014_20]